MGGSMTLEQAQRSRDGNLRWTVDVLKQRFEELRDAATTYWSTRAKLVGVVDVESPSDEHYWDWWTRDWEEFVGYHPDVELPPEDPFGWNTWNPSGRPRRRDAAKDETSQMLEFCAKAQALINQIESLDTGALDPLMVIYTPTDLEEAGQLVLAYD